MLISNPQMVNHEHAIERVDRPKFRQKLCSLRGMGKSGLDGMILMLNMIPIAKIFFLVEKLDLNVSGAQGMLYAFESLYLSVNGGPGSGLYRARETNHYFL